VLSVCCCRFQVCDKWSLEALLLPTVSRGIFFLLVVRCWFWLLGVSVGGSRLFLVVWCWLSKGNCWLSSVGGRCWYLVVERCLIVGVDCCSLFICRCPSSEFNTWVVKAHALMQIIAKCMLKGQGSTCLCGKPVTGDFDDFDRNLQNVPPQLFFG
jgi:hypothetical protein